MEEEKKTDQLCPKCRTGYEAYQLDSTSPVCPYLASHNGKECAMYVEMEAVVDHKRD